MDFTRGWKGDQLPPEKAGPPNLPQTGRQKQYLANVESNKCSNFAQQTARRRKQLCQTIDAEYDGSESE